MAETEHRLFGADFVRASACFIVLFHHLAQRIDPRSELGQYDLAQVLTSGGGFGVAMFFVLSGFLLARPFWQALDAGRPLPSLRTYALRRSARIVPGFWLALTVTFVFSVTVFGFRADGWLWMRYLAGLLLVSDWHWTTLFPVEINGPLWSIGFEVTSYLLMPMGMALLFAFGSWGQGGWRGKLASRAGWVLVIALALSAHWLFHTSVQVDPAQKGWQYGLQGGAKTWMPWFNPFGFFAMFATGSLAAALQVLIGRLRSVAFDFMALAAFGGAAWIVWTSGLRGGGEFYGLLRVPYDFPSFHLLIALGLAVTPSSQIVGRLLDNRVVRYLAMISFGVYVWHYLVLELVRHYWLPEIQHGGMSDLAVFLVGAAVITAITIAIATLSYRWLEAPILAWARQFERKPAAQPAGTPSGPNSAALSKG